MDKRVEAAIRRSRSSGVTGRPSEPASALDAMTDTGRPEEVTQWRLQQFCWEVLPNATGISRNDRLLAALALASLLARFDLRRYAEIAGGQRTRSLIERSASGTVRPVDWRGGSPRESGITPPDTDLLTWVTGARSGRAGRVRAGSQRARAGLRDGGARAGPSRLRRASAIG